MKVCEKCFNDNEIKAYIDAQSSEVDTCDCCGNVGKLLDIEEFFDFFMMFFQIFEYENVDGEELIDIMQNDWNLFKTRDIGLIILSDDILQTDLKYQLNLQHSSVVVTPNIKVRYIEDIRESVDFWEELKKDLKHKRRFLTNISMLENYGWDAAFSVFSTIDSSVNLYRSRINTDDSEVPFPADEMSAPPKEKSTAGRANPPGIPYLYLSKDLKTTLFESRATFLDYVSVGVFRIGTDHSFEIVDFTKDESPFNKENIIDFAKGKFIRRVVSRDLSKPLRRYDSELEYIPTQFICEYIRFFTSPAIGIQFKSSLDKDGVNIVLFDDSKIECTSVETHQITNIDIDSKSIR